MTTIRLLRFASVVALLLGAATVRAESAKATYQRGLDLYAAGNYDGAAAAFVQAYTMKPKPLILFNIAQAYRKGGHFGEALTYYKRFLDEAPPPEKAPLEDEVKKYVAEIEAHEALQRSLIEKADREEAEKVEPVKKPPPPGQTSAPPPGQTPPPQPQAQPGQAQPAPTPAVTPIATETKEADKPVYKKWWLWTIVGGVAVAGLAIGLGVGLSGGGNNGPDTALGTRSPQF